MTVVHLHVAEAISVPCERLSKQTAGLWLSVLAKVLGVLSSVSAVVEPVPAAFSVLVGWPCMHVCFSAPASYKHERPCETLEHLFSSAGMNRYFTRS